MTIGTTGPKSMPAPEARPGSIVRCGDGSTWKLIERYPDVTNRHLTFQRWRAHVVNPADNENHEFVDCLEFDPSQIEIVAAKPRSNR